MDEKSAPQGAFRRDRNALRAHVQPRAADDDLAQFDDDARILRERRTVDARPVARAEVPHADATVREQRQLHVQRRHVFVVDDDVTGQIAAHAAFGAGALEASLQQRLPVRADLLDQHHGFHRRAPR